MYYHNVVIPQIKKLVNDPTIIIILRNPVERAFSNYTFLKEYEPNSFEEALALEEQRKNNGWNSFWFYAGQGFYYEQVNHYLTAFPKVKIVLMDDFSKDVDAEMKAIFDFLEVDPIEINTKTIYNKSGVPRNKFIEWLIFKDNFLKKIPRYFINKIYDSGERARIKRNIQNRFIKKGDLTISEQTYNHLVDGYHEDILKLQDLIQKDLSGWLNKK
jgi:hypothetical protein